MTTRRIRTISVIGGISLVLSGYPALLAAQASPVSEPAQAGASTQPGPIAPPADTEAKVLPPPPAGYEYVLAPTAPAQPQEDPSNRLKDIDARLSALRAERQQRSLVGPIVMMATGYGASLISGLVAISTFSAAEDIQHDDYWDDDWRDYDVNDDGVVDHDDEKTYRRIARGIGVLSFVSMGVGIGGSVLFANQMRERNRNLPEIRSLQHERWQLRRQLEYGTNLTHGGMQLSLKGRF